jgi:uracil-DNA glycosylase
MATACCRHRLIDELRVVDPVVIIPLGNYALQTLTGNDGAKIYNYRGSRQEIDLAALSDFLHRAEANV